LFCEFTSGIPSDNAFAVMRHENQGTQRKHDGTYSLRSESIFTPMVVRWATALSDAPHAPPSMDAVLQAKIESFSLGAQERANLPSLTTAHQRFHLLELNNTLLHTCTAMYLTEP